jgi:hypothetical protein
MSWAHAEPKDASPTTQCQLVRHLPGQHPFNIFRLYGYCSTHVSWWLPAWGTSCVLTQPLVQQAAQHMLSYA